MKYQRQSDTGNNGYVSLEQEKCVPIYELFNVAHKHTISYKSLNLGSQYGHKQLRCHSLKGLCVKSDVNYFHYELTIRHI